MSHVDTLAFRLAIRLVMEEIWYSNAVPEWYTPEEIDEPARIERLVERADRYLEGEEPLSALSLNVPRVKGGLRPWVVPAVNDQMILQACVAKLAEELANSIDARHVYSFRPNNDPSRIALMEPQLAALLEFHKETMTRLQGGDVVLEFDIESAFASIDRGRFYEFLQQLNPNGVEVRLIRRLMDSWSGAAPGIPLVNDSVFFLGSAYLGVVDNIVSGFTDDFIRYMDDYRVFGRNKADLESVFERINRAMGQLELRINPRKVKIRTIKDLRQPAIEPRFAKIESGEYVIDLDVGMRDQIEPEQLAALVEYSLESPDYYLNEGIGRHLLGALRRYRLNLAIYRRADEDSDLGTRLRNALKNPSTVRLTSKRLAEYGTEPGNAWRAIWVIYLIEQQRTSEQFSPQLAEIEQSARMPTVVKLWARRCRLGIGGEPLELVEALHDMSYVDAGQQCYGERVCTGEGF
jgi:hypothetical protein